MLKLINKNQLQKIIKKLNLEKWISLIKRAYQIPIVRWLSIVSGTTLLVVFILSFMFSIILSNLAIVDFMLAISPKTFLDGVNILALGIDDTEGVQRSDTIMVLHMDLKHERIGVLSIPRDTRVNVPGVGFTKINHAYANGGEELSRETVAQFLGVPIKYYVVLKLKGLESVVDELGGVMIDVQKDMYYVDQSGDLHIDLKKGPQVLNGKKSMEYVRFRHDKDSDIGRIARQQGFLQSASDQVIHSRKVLSMPGLIQMLRKNFDTNLSLTQVIGLASQCRNAVKSGNLDVATVPGVPILMDGVSYWRADVAATEKIVHTTLGGDEATEDQIVSNVQTVDKESSLEKRRRVTIKEVNRSITDSGTDVSTLDGLSKVVVTEILNGIGVPREAKRAMKILKHPRIKFAHTGNAGTFQYDNTLVVVWKGNSHVNDALIVARFLSIDPSKIIVYDKPEKPLDITIVLGQDWESIKTKIQNKNQQAEN